MIIDKSILKKILEKLHNVLEVDSQNASIDTMEYETEEEIRELIGYVEGLIDSQN